MIQTCSICTKDRATDQCPSLPELKAVFKEVEEGIESAYLMAQCRQWKARPSGMPQDLSLFFPMQYHQHQSTRTTWEGQPTFFSC